MESPALGAASVGVSFGSLPHSRGAVGSGILQYTASLHEGSAPWYPSVHVQSLFCVTAH